jgi:hypothetical protein
MLHRCARQSWTTAPHSPRSSPSRVRQRSSRSSRCVCVPACFLLVPRGAKPDGMVWHGCGQLLTPSARDESAVAVRCCAPLSTYACVRVSRCGWRSCVRCKARYRERRTHSFRWRSAWKIWSRSGKKRTPALPMTYHRSVGQGWPVSQLLSRSINRKRHSCLYAGARALVTRAVHNAGWPR